MSDHCHSKSRLDWAFAHLILRLWVGFRLLMAGLDKMREKGGDGFGLEYISKSMAPIVDNMTKYANGHVIPWKFAIPLYANVLPWALIITGVWCILGIFTRWGLLFGGLTFVSLAFGLMALPDDQEAVFRGIEVGLTALALITAANNQLSLDGLLFRKGACCEKKSAE